MTDIISRGVPLDDLSVTGRTVTAYAAVFDSPTEINDGQGRYNETINRAAFNKTIKESGKRAGYFYNHGMTIHGTPSDMGSVPLGAPERMSADSKGLLTVSRVSKTPFGDAILEAINDGGITGYSFTGRVIRSDPQRMPRKRTDGSLPTITRMELGLREYGPTPFPAYSDASILSVRSNLPTNPFLGTMTEDERAAMLYEFLMRFTGGYQPDRSATSFPDAGTGVPSADTHTDRIREEIQERISRSGVGTWHETQQGTQD